MARQIKRWSWLLAASLGLIAPVVRADPSSGVPSGQRTVARPRHAAAAADPDVWSDPVAIEAQFGVATPVGGLGLALDYAPVPWLAVNAGVGTNFQGVQLALTPRLRATFDQEALTLGTGLSVGRHTQIDGRDGFETPLLLLSSLGDNSVSIVRHWDWAPWWNVEVGFEMRKPSRPTGRFYVGLARLLDETPTSVRIQNTGSPNNTNVPDRPLTTTLLYLGFAIGSTL